MNDDMRLHITMKEMNDALREAKKDGFCAGLIPGFLVGAIVIGLLMSTGTAHGADYHEYREISKNNSQWAVMTLPNELFKEKVYRV